MKTLLIGGRGQLGHDLTRLLGDAAVVADVPDIDVCDPKSVTEWVTRTRPDAIINCAAQTNVDRCEDEADEAFAINAIGARNVAAAAEQAGASVIYISTDYVFGAQGPRLFGYGETECPGPISVYGASKLAGEHLTLAECSRSLVVRTCGLYGHAGARGKGGNFVETMLRLANEGKEVRVVDDQYLSPTSTVECAAKVVELCRAEARGLVHVASSDHCSWHAFAGAIFEHLDVDMAVEPIPSSAYPVRARRPLMSALRSERLEELGIGACRGWREMLVEYLESRPSTVGAAASSGG